MIVFTDWASFRNDFRNQRISFVARTHVVDVCDRFVEDARNI